MHETASAPGYVLTMSCPDRTGIVAAITTFRAENDGLITEAAHYVDEWSDRSFMRTTFRGGCAADCASLRAQFSEVAKRFDMDWAIHDAGRRCRVLIAVSRQGHCLNSLLHRWSIGVLPIDVVGVVSNHEDQRRLVEWYGLPFHFLPISPGQKHQQEAEILHLFSAENADVLVLARYMQVLTGQTCERLGHRCINIHHSFLPGFKGARPYHQAYERGVKIIGATAHYVTRDLDDGPIIEQGVERVDHTMTPSDLVELGHDLESIVLNRAVRWHAEHRVFVARDRTIVLRS